MSISDILFLYRARMAAKAVLVQEAFAVLGIAVGVALLFASQVASTSLAHSVEQLTHQLVGRTQLQIHARGPGGFDERLLEKVRHAPGVAAAFPVIEQQANVRGPRGERAVDLFGVDPRMVHFGGPTLHRFSVNQLSAQHAVALPTDIAKAVGVGSLEPIDVQIRGIASEALLGAVLSESDIGTLAQASVLIAPVLYAQHLAGMKGMISRIFVRIDPGRENEVRSELAALAAGAGANVQPATFDSTLFRVASSTENQGETLFSAISALVGFMFALNAMLVTVPARRRLIEDIRPQGATRRMIVQILLVDAGVIGTLACILGLGFGALLSISAFHSTPGYLSSAFPIGNGRIVTWQSVVLACVAGIVAAAVGVLWPLQSLITQGQPNGGESSSKDWHISKAARVAIGIVCLITTTIVLIFYTRGWFVGTVALVVALVCLLPSLFDFLVGLFDSFQERFLDGAATVLAVIELRNPRTRIRSLAVALTGAIAVFGAVAVGGAQINLRHGLQASASGIDEGADVWVSPKGQSGLLATSPFQNVGQGALARLAGVAAFGDYRGSFLDWGDRRLWVLAPPSNTKQPISPTQLVSGNLAVADADIREGGWVVLSKALAAEHHLSIGASVILPAPNPTRLRVAALSTNMGWPPGAIIVNSRDYARVWGDGAPSAYEIQVKPDIAPATVKREVAQVIGSSTGLVVETLAERQHRHFALIDQGLARLTQIKLLVLIAGALAIAGAMGSMIWQRRDLIAFMKVDGYRRAVLWRWLFCETVLMLTVGCLAGALFGLYGQLLISHALATVTGLPISLGVEVVIALSSFLLVGTLVAVIVALPGYLVVRVPASTVAPAY
ncbi:MAG TPA: FtsX-like permease family protein [Solirubrobacteraceae bacterium]